MAVVLEYARTNLAKKGAVLGRTTTEHERLLDHFDDLLALDYLYESEFAKNPDLGRLKALALMVAGEVHLPENAPLFPDQRAKRLGIIQVMNGLQCACRMKAPPPITAFDAAWDGLPAVLNGRALQLIHSKQEELLADMFSVLVARLDASFPSETKPFVTREQVAAMLRSLRGNRLTDFAGPIQVDIFNGLAHQEFLAALDRGTVPLSAPDSAQILAREYVRQAERSFVKMVNDSFIETMVANHYPHARRLREYGQLRLTIDRVYPWGALWQQPLAAREALNLYARLNLSGAFLDAKFRAAGAPGAAIPSAEFIRWAVHMIPRPAEPDREAAARLFFASDNTELRFDGKLLQKHAVIAVRYDRPLPDVEATLRRFRNYLISQRKRYCADGGEALNEDEIALSRLRDADLLNNFRAVRNVLHDKSSVLGHLCALMDLEMQRDPEYAHESKKARILIIGGWVREAGFAYGYESIRKSCSRSPTEIAALRTRFACG